MHHKSSSTTTRSYMTRFTEAGMGVVVGGSQGYVDSICALFAFQASVYRKSTSVDHEARLVPFPVPRLDPGLPASGLRPSRLRVVW